MKTKVKLIGTDGNIFALIALCVKAARKDKWTPEDIQSFTKKIMNSESYNEALNIICENFEVE